MGEDPSCRRRGSYGVVRRHPRKSKGHAPFAPRFGSVTIKGWGRCRSEKPFIRDTDGLDVPPCGRRWSACGLRSLPLALGGLPCRRAASRASTDASARVPSNAGLHWPSGLAFSICFPGSTTGARSRRLPRPHTYPADTSDLHRVEFGPDGAPRAKNANPGPRARVSSAHTTPPSPYA